MIWSKPRRILDHCMRSVLLSKTRFLLSVSGIAITTMLVCVCVISLDSYARLELARYSEYTPYIITAAGMDELPAYFLDDGFTVYPYELKETYLARSIPAGAGEISFTADIYAVQTNALDCFMPSFEFEDTLFRPQISSGRAFVPDDADTGACVIGEFESWVLFGRADGAGGRILVPVRETVQVSPGVMKSVVKGYRSYTVVGVIRNDSVRAGQQQDAGFCIANDASGSFQLRVFAAQSSVENPYIRIIRSKDPAARSYPSPEGRIVTMHTIRDRLSFETRRLNGTVQAAYLAMLFVFGMSLMNVMFFSVKERVVEIGVKKSLGAQSEDILIEFLVEGGVISAAGAALGELVGLCVTAAGALVLKSSAYPALVIQVSGLKMLAVFTVSVVFGVIFALIPAHAASSTRITDALHFD